MARRSGSSTSTRPPSSPCPTRPSMATEFSHTTNASFLQYVARVSALSLQGTLRLYHRLLQLEIKPVFLSGRTEDQIGVTTHNLLSQGYSSWEKLLLQPIGLQTSTQAFKTSERKKLVDAGYVIVGNIGDQWSDILGSPEGCRTFKYPNPNPMYYVA
uniref:Acid phosphatase n=1 Tax=Oryza barthii TaxID=65489 RepID=A0A0D3G443_9ORYZ